MYEWYATQKVTGVGIAKRLNDFGLRNRSGRPWDAQNILRIRSVPSYAVKLHRIERHRFGDKKQ
jgi:hypothetical protein